jgi:hypothetical protein
MSAKYSDIEVEIYKSRSGRAEFPQVYWSGQKDEFMVFELSQT